MKVGVGLRVKGHVEDRSRVRTLPPNLTYYVRLTLEDERVRKSRFTHSTPTLLKSPACVPGRQRNVGGKLTRHTEHETTGQRTLTNSSSL